MGWFSGGRARLRGDGLPADIVDLAIRFGRFDADPQRSDEDPGAIYPEIQAPLLSFVQKDPTGFTAALAAAVLPVGGPAVFGATHLAWDLLVEEHRRGPAYDSLMTASLEFLRASGVPLTRLTGYERDHWFARGGTAASWLPLNKARAPDAAPERGS